MDDLSHKFIEEANELLEKLEDALFVLEEQPENMERINEVFRVMHTLKGSGAMFGFGHLSNFTHELENVFDNVRSGKLPVSKKLLNKTFRSIDFIRQLLSQEVSEEALQEATNFIHKLKTEFLTNAEEPVPLHADDSDEDAKPDGTLTTPDERSVWLIHFEPNKHTLKQGSRPLFLLDELFDFGKVKAWLHTDHLPDLEHLDPEDAFFYWDIFLATDRDENHIRDVFVFVEDDSIIEITKLDDYDYLGSPIFEEQARLLDFASFIDKDKIDKLKLALSAHEQKLPKLMADEQQVKDTTAEEKTDKRHEDQKTTALRPEKPNKPQSGLSTIRISSEKLDVLLNLVSEMVTIQARLEHYESEKNDPVLGAIVESYQKLSYQLRENALEMRLVPFFTILTRFKRLVRDLSEELHKNVQFVTKGTETELDKSMIEKLYDPIMHILRNSIDHGIETPAERTKSGKPEKGLLQINTYNSGANVVIEISDDGRGIDVEKIRQKAVQKALILPEENFPEKELMNLIFKPGFSTSQKVTDVSGRGVGMDVVKKNIADLRGEVEVMSRAGEGTTVRIVLPLTLSIIDGLLVYIGRSRYIIPIDNVKHVYEIDEKELSGSYKPVVVKDNRQIPFINLIDEFKETPAAGQRLYLVVLHYNNKEMGVIINDIAGKYQTVIKPVGKIIQQKEFFSGASILGDGEVALVMDTNRIINQFINE